MTNLKNKHVKSTLCPVGPFVVLASLGEDDPDGPMVITPPGGYSTIEEAEKYIETHFANRKEPYLGIEFIIVPMRTPVSFIEFCSWEE